MSTLSTTDRVEQGAISDDVSTFLSGESGSAIEDLASENGDGHDTVSQSPELLAWLIESYYLVELNQEEALVTQFNPILKEKPAERTYENPEPVDNNSDSSASPVSDDSRSRSSLEASGSEPGEGCSLETSCEINELAIISPDLADKVEAAEPLAYGEISVKDLANSEQYSNNFLEIKKSELGGNGVFAKTDLKRGQIILAEKPTISASPANLYREIDKLAPELQRAFSRLSRHKRSPCELVIMLTTMIRFAIDELSCVYLIASRFNHACPPLNSVGNRVVGGRVMEFRMKRDVPAGTELTIAYGPLSPWHLYRMWGFRCSCGGCTPLTDEEVAQIEGKSDAEGIW
ncbi:SET domain-containing protein [Hypoxylon sp. FL0890]|nr:SET domain-containing protein [Hypoxylon sp. FL0890]